MKTKLTTTQVQPGVWRTSNDRFDLIKGAKGYTVQAVNGPTVAGPYTKKAAALLWCEQQPAAPVLEPSQPLGEARYREFIADGAKLQTYASGDGSISFTYVKRRVGDDQLISTGSPKSVEEIPASAIREGYILGIVNGDPRLFRPVTRISAEILLMGGQQFTYSIEHKYEHGNTYHFWSGKLPVLNVSIKGALTFYLNHEEQILAQTPEPLAA